MHSAVRVNSKILDLVPWWPTLPLLRFAISVWIISSLIIISCSKYFAPLVRAAKHISQICMNGSSTIPTCNWMTIWGHVITMLLFSNRFQLFEELTRHIDDHHQTLLIIKYWQQKCSCMHKLSCYHTHSAQCSYTQYTQCSYTQYTLCSYPKYTQCSYTQYTRCSYTQYMQCSYTQSTHSAHIHSTHGAHIGAL